MTFNDASYGELIKVINSDLTDLNQFVEDLLTSEPVDPNLKRKRICKPRFTKRC